VLVAYLVLVAVSFALGSAAFIMAIPIGFAVFSDLQGGVGTAVLIGVFGALFGGFFGVYSVAFYRTIDSGVTDGS
jgi:hypothetical protein